VLGILLVRVYASLILLCMHDLSPVFGTTLSAAPLAQACDASKTTFIFRKDTLLTNVAVLDARERGGPLGAPSYAADIVIEDDCWIGAGVIVLAGVTVGAGSVVGAGAVVTEVWTIISFFPQLLLFPQHLGQSVRSSVTYSRFFLVNFA
jgi:hypothetical protein